MKLSLLVPCFNEEENIIPFTERVREVFKNPEDYEIVFVNDGSKDKTSEKIKLLMAEKKEKIRLVSFSRNFGKESAMYAGLKKTTGELVAIIDADLQQDPIYVEKMVDILNKNPNVDAVCAYQEKRKENFVISALKTCFYKTSNILSDVKMEENASDFRVLRRNVVESILSLKEVQRFSKGIFSFVGFNTLYIPYEVKQRNAGVSKWSVTALFKYAFSGITAFSVKPLKIPFVLAFLTFLSALVLLVIFAIKGFEIYKGLIVIMLGLFSLVFFCLAILGEYVSLIFLQSKERPIYIIKEEIEN